MPLTRADDRQLKLDDIDQFVKIKNDLSVDKPTGDLAVTLIANTPGNTAALNIQGANGPANLQISAAGAGNPTASLGLNAPGDADISASSANVEARVGAIGPSSDITLVGTAGEARLDWQSSGDGGSIHFGPTGFKFGLLPGGSGPEETSIFVDASTLELGHDAATQGLVDVDVYTRRGLSFLTAFTIGSGPPAPAIYPETARNLVYGNILGDTDYVAVRRQKGGLRSEKLATPIVTGVSPQGVPGVTAWGYRVTAVGVSGGETAGSPEVTTTTGNALPDATNFNRINISHVTGAIKYRVYRTTAGGTPSTLGFIGETAGEFFDDTGLATTGFTALGSPQEFSTSGATHMAEVTGLRIRHPGGFGFGNFPFQYPAAATPFGPNQGANWDYTLVARKATGVYEVRTGLTSGFIAPITLGGGSFIRIRWRHMPGVVQYDLYRVQSGGTPSTLGLIATVTEPVEGWPQVLIVDDGGFPGNGVTPPTGGSSGDVLLLEPVGEFGSFIAWTGGLDGSDEVTTLVTGVRMGLGTNVPFDEGWTLAAVTYNPAGGYTPTEVSRWITANPDTFPFDWAEMRLSPRGLQVDGVNQPGNHPYVLTLFQTAPSLTFINSNAEEQQWRIWFRADAADSLVIDRKVSADFTGWVAFDRYLELTGNEVIARQSLRIENNDPQLRVRDADTPVDGGGLYRLINAAGTLRIDFNTAAAGDFSTHKQALTVTDGGEAVGIASRLFLNSGGASGVGVVFQGAATAVQSANNTLFRSSADNRLHVKDNAGVDQVLAYLSEAGGGGNTVLVSEYVTKETPAGTVDGVNAVFTLANTPEPGSEEVYLNGLQQYPGVGEDYTIAGGTITFNTPPQTGDKVRVSYIRQ